MFLRLYGYVLGFRTEEFVGRDGRPGVFHRMTVFAEDGRTLVCKVPGRVLSTVDDAAIRQHGTPVEIECHPSQYSDFGKLTPCVEADEIHIVSAGAEGVPVEANA